MHTNNIKRENIVSQKNISTIYIKTSKPPGKGHEIPADKIVIDSFYT